jgi:hypothetical protein
VTLRAIHTVPLWEEEDGSRTLGLDFRPDHPPVVGWCNAARIEINGELRWFLLTLDADA